jgi:hypothetical protein
LSRGGSDREQTYSDASDRGPRYLETTQDNGPPSLLGPSSVPVAGSISCAQGTPDMLPRYWLPPPKTAASARATTTTMHGTIPRRAF